MAAAKIIGGVPHKYCRRCADFHPRSEFVRLQGKDGKPGRISRSCRRWEVPEVSDLVIPPPAIRVVMREQAVSAATQPRFAAVRDQAYLELFARQGGVCHACGFAERVTDRDGNIVPLTMYLNVESGPRVPLGLLCRSCTSALSLLDHDLQRILQLAELLKRAPCLVPHSVQVVVVAPTTIAKPSSITGATSAEPRSLSP